MGISGVIGVLGRRWYVVLGGLVVTAGLVWGAYTVFPPTYQTRGLVLLIPPITEQSQGANPFLGLGGLDLPARVVVASFSSNAAQEDIARQAPEAKVEVSMEESTRGPVIAVDVEDISAQGALTTLSYVTGLIPQTLERLQDEVGAPAGTTVTSLPLTMDTEAEMDVESLARTLVLAAGAGVALTVVTIVLLEALTMRPLRSRRGTRSTRTGRRRSDESRPPVVRSAPRQAAEAIPLLHATPAEPRPAVPARATRHHHVEDAGA